MQWSPRSKEQAAPCAPLPTNSSYLLPILNSHHQKIKPQMLLRLQGKKEPFYVFGGM